MKLKVTLLLSFILLFVTQSYSQAYKDDIKQRFTEFNKLIMDKKFEKSMDYIPDALFTFVPRAELVAVFDQMMNMKEMDVKFLDFKIDSIGNAKKIDTNYYSSVRYTSSMTMKFNIAEQETATQKTTRLSAMKATFANIFGTDRVKLDESTEIFTLNPSKSSWAISGNGQTGWKFINVEPGQRIIMEKILPKELIDN
jgi:hypothetical protein